jgi:hypothetical protein
MLKENVVRAAGVKNCTTEEALRRIIRDASFRPAQMDTLYRQYFLNQSLKFNCLYASQKCKRPRESGAVREKPINRYPAKVTELLSSACRSKSSYFKEGRIPAQRTLHCP